MPLPRKRARARSIVPSPPSTIAMSASSPSTRSTPCRVATARSRSSASPAPSPSRSITTTDARLTDGIGDPPVEVGRPFGVFSVDEVEDELMVSLRAGQPGVYDPARLSPACEQRVCNLGHDTALHFGVAHDALWRLRASGFELRLHEHE